MADNPVYQSGTLASLPVGTTPAADDVIVTGMGGTALVQFVKLVDGTANGTQPIAGDTANGLDVDVTRLPALAAGTNNIGDVDVLTVPAPLSTSGHGTAAAALRVELPTDGTGVIATVGAVTAITNALPAGSNVIGALTANQSTNTAQINGVAPSMGNGVSGTGVQRVTLASDSTGQVALAAGAATIGSLAANQSVNVAQINGVAATMGNGVSGTGVQRVTLASDSTGQVTLATGANTIGALTANQSVNQTQLAGNAISAGNGASGTGVQRVTIANDSTGVLATVSTVTTVGTVTTLTGGGIAHDAPDSGNPVKVGARARTTDITSVASDDRVDAIADKAGKRIVLPYSIPELFVSGVSTMTSSTADTSTIAAGGAGIRTYITSFSFANTSATATLMEIKDGSTVKWRTIVPAGGGSNHTFTTPLVGTANTAWNCACITSVASVYGSLAGYQGA